VFFEKKRFTRKRGGSSSRVSTATGTRSGMAGNRPWGADKATRLGGVQRDVKCWRSGCVRPESLRTLGLYRTILLNSRSASPNPLD